MKIIIFLMFALGVSLFLVYFFLLKREEEGDTIDESIKEKEKDVERIERHKKIEKEEGNSRKDEYEDEEREENKLELLKNNDIEQIEALQLGVAYRKYFKEIEQIAKLIIKMYDEKILNGDYKMISKYIRENGIYEETLIGSVTEEIIKADLKLLDRPTFIRAVEGVLGVVKNEFMGILPRHIKENPNFQYGLNGGKRTERR